MKRALAKIPAAEEVVFQPGADDACLLPISIDKGVLRGFEEAEVVVVFGLHREGTAGVVTAACATRRVSGPVFSPLRNWAWK